MRLLRSELDGKLTLTEDLTNDKLPAYAILSHTWAQDKEELTFRDVVEGKGEKKHGFVKVQFCLRQANLDGLRSVEFFSRQGKRLGDKRSLSREIHEITGIPLEALQVTTLSSFTRKERMSWARNRTTKLEEDMAYSLLGIFEAHMPLIYGEGLRNSFIRLDEAIDKTLAFQRGIPQGSQIDNDSVYQSFINRETEAHNTHEGPPAQALSDVERSYLLSLWFPTIDQRRLSIDKPADKTCFWIFEHSLYKDWFSEHSRKHHHGLLWLKGNPGAGKSTLIKEVFSQISRYNGDQKWHTAAFFFNAKGDTLERSPVGLLRSLLYQLLPRHRQKLQKLSAEWGEYVQERPARAEAMHDFWCEPELQDAFRSIFDTPTDERAFIFIDALDECQSESIRHQVCFWQDFTRRASQNKVLLNVCISIRNFPNVSTGPSPVISVDDCNSHDIAQYVGQQLLFAMPTADTQRKLISQKILDKSSGNFLWVVLVLNDILEGWDKGSGIKYLLKRLDVVPKGLTTLFSHIFSSISEEEKRLALHLFQWATLAVKPLRLHEWHHIIAFLKGPIRSLNDWRFSDNFTETDDQLEKVIKNVSKGLVEVKTIMDGSLDENLESMSTRAGAGSLNLERGETRIVQTIHESVREFFIYGSGFSTVDANSPSNFIRQGHISIMGTCLDYINISELDALVMARTMMVSCEKSPRSASQSSWQHQENKTTRSELARHEADNNPMSLSFVDGPRKAGRLVLSSTSSLYVPETNCGGEPGDSFDFYLGDKMNGTSSSSSLTNGKMLVKEHTSHSVYRQPFNKVSPASDIMQWLRTLPMDITNQEWTAQWGSPCSSPTHLSATGQSQTLEDYPALLSYATTQLFTHARLAQDAGADPSSIVARLYETQTWVRWVALREEPVLTSNLSASAYSHGLTSWIHCIERNSVNLRTFTSRENIPLRIPPPVVRPELVPDAPHTIKHPTRRRVEQEESQPGTSVLDPVTDSRPILLSRQSISSQSRISRHNTSHNYPRRSRSIASFGSAGSHTEANYDLKLLNDEVPADAKTRHSPRQLENKSDLDLKTLQTKYKKAKKLYFKNKDLIEKLAEHVGKLQNLVSNENIWKSCVAPNDNEQYSRFDLLDIAITNLAFNIRRSWRSVPTWIEGYITDDAMKTGKREMVAVGRAIITQWVVTEIFDKYYHPGLEGGMNHSLKVVEKSIRRSSHRIESNTQLDATVQTWRGATWAMIQHMLNSNQSQEKLIRLKETTTENLLASISQQLTSLQSPGIVENTSAIANYAIDIASDIATDTRDVVITLPQSGDLLRPDVMELQRGFPPLGRIFDDTRDHSQNTPALESYPKVITLTGQPDVNTERIRYAGFVAVEIVGYKVLRKAPVWALG
ncbi:putative nb-arc and ankyrin domain protein [Rosellinia necatrix]|uniref:Putative nb-arc and ankyrin domain protein n=1 Tax=Rosellinia necatrix TaxID=77044 RepID=A0A1W2TXE1_ROSNE|nr:putative nb-arc and ankyrin domain protein [Rosellinia necatrix]